MGSITIIKASGLGSGGSDVTPSALDWDDITTTQIYLGLGDNSGSEQTLAAIDAVIQIKAAWTSTSSSPAKGVWVKNGAEVGDYVSTPAYVNATVGDKLYFLMRSRNVFGEGNYDTGTVTVTNESDGAATLDTFTFEVQYVYSTS